jgi:micrococcal nuclease
MSPSGRPVLVAGLAVLLVVAGCLGASPATPAPAPGEANPTSAPDGDAGGATTTTTTAASSAPATATPTPAPSTAPRQRATVVEVVDGDTVKVRFANGSRETVRLLGVDTPEVHAENTPGEFEGVPETEAGRACLRRAGEAASAYARDRLAGREVGLGFDENEGRRGYYGRLLAYVYVDGTQFNYGLVAEGHARMYDSQFVDRKRFADAETAARAADRGLWSCAEGTTPTDGADGDGDGEGSGSGVRIAEIVADAPGNDNDNLDGEYVVVANGGADPVDLSGWTLTDEAGHRYRFPAGTTLASGESLRVVTGSGSDGDGRLYWGRGGAVWNNGGDTATLQDESGRVVAERSY